MTPPTDLPPSPNTDNDPPYTAWHHLLVQTLTALVEQAGPGLLTILPFYKLGTLPLEADVLLLLKEVDGADLSVLVPDFDFSMRYLAPVTVVEYKSPDVVLTWGHLDTAMAYAFLAKRDQKRKRAGDVALHLWHSYKEKDFLQTCQDNGFDFQQIEPGVMCCQRWPLRIYLMNLVELSDRRPEDMINLLSARHRRFVLQAGEGPRAATILRLYYTVLQETMKMLMHDKSKNLPGAVEVVQDIKELRRLFAASLTREEKAELVQELPAEDRLKGLPAEDRLKGLPAEDRLKGLPAEDRLKGLPAEDRLKGLPAEDRLKGLPPEDLARLRALLNR